MQLTSKSQMARVFTEGWIADNGYCLACETDRLLQTRANTQARDFECEKCRHPYELKSSIRPFREKVVDGAYASLMRRIETDSVPSFLLLRYTDAQTVVGLTAIHHSLITPEIIQRRKPLSETARRAGWIGCNLLLRGIPPEGRIEVIADGIHAPKSLARSIFKATENLSSKTLSGRSWARAVLSCIHRIDKSRFQLADVYAFEAELMLLYPGNHNIRAKIRQQLQVLRDAGLLLFEGEGTYRIRFGSAIQGVQGEY